MKIKLLQVVSITLVIVLSGCGGNNPTPAINFKHDRITIAGSSITHGNIANGDNEGAGYLGELSYVGQVGKSISESISLIPLDRMNCRRQMM